MKINRLTEDTLETAVKRDAQQAASEIDNEVVVDGHRKGAIEKALDKLLKVNKRQVKSGGHEFVNLLLIGRAGVGKTAIVKRWAADNGINLVSKDAKTLDPTDLGGVIARDENNPNKATRLSNNEFDSLNAPNSVLFLDEYNRAPSDVRGSLLTLVNDHIVNDQESPNGERFLENFLFTVAAINPPTAGYNTDALDAAERSRFYQEYVEAEPDVLLDFLVNKQFKPQLEATDDPEEQREIEGRIKLATTLLSNREFMFDTEEDEERATDVDPNAPILNPRSFTKALETSDGTKEDFLYVWDRICNRDKKGMVERILSNYQDVEDKANDVLKRYKGGEESEDEVAPAFAKAAPDYFDSLGL